MYNMDQQNNIEENQWKINILQDYINSPEQQQIVNKQIYEIQAIQVIQELCRQKAIISVNQTGTTKCLFCKQFINFQSQKSHQHFCQNSFHDKCFKEKYEQKNPNFSENVYLNCTACDMEFYPQLVEEIYGQESIKLQKALQCVLCQNVINQKTQKFLQHFCDKPFHHLCLKDRYLQDNPTLNTSYKLLCSICNLDFMIEHFHEAFGGKQKFDLIKEQQDEEYIRQLQIELKQELSKEAEERKFECEICMGEGNINQDCRTLDNCLHRFCQDCLREHIRAQKNDGKIECPLCKDTPVDERKFPDPNHPPNYVHDPHDIEIKMPIIKDLLPKDEFETLEELWTRKFYKATNNRTVLLCCPGYMKKKTNQQLSDLELIIKPDIHQKMLKGNLQNLGFEFQNCQAMYELDLNIQVNKYRCKACDLEFCPQCKDEGHTGTCEEYKKWKIENEKGDQAMEELIKAQPNVYKQCPSCKAYIMKASGCNRVPCANKKCNAHICWVCMQHFKTAAEGYKHIEQNHKGKLWDQ